jgi:hypothetical protein
MEVGTDKCSDVAVTGDVASACISFPITIESAMRPTEKGLINAVSSAGGAGKCL